MTNKPTGREERSFPSSIRLEERQGGARRIRGYAAVFDQWSSDLGGYKERIRPGAFAEALTRDDTRALFDHATGQLLARRSAGTLMLEEDRHGLAVVIELPNTQLGRDVAELVRRGDLNQMSFAFQVDRDGQEWDSAGLLRTITRVSKLWEVSLVVFPAYEQTSAALRAARGGGDLDARVRDAWRRHIKQLRSLLDESAR